jgi:hypothetical protein
MDPFKPWQPKPRISAPPALDAEAAQAVALQAVAFIAADDELLPRFVALSGCGLDDLKARIEEPSFLGGVLDFILADEPTLLAFAEAGGFPPETPMAARAKLP